MSAEWKSSVPSEADQPSPPVARRTEEIPMDDEIDRKPDTKWMRVSMAERLAKNAREQNLSDLRITSETERSFETLKTSD
jgi:hypothetical protein